MIRLLEVFIDTQLISNFLIIVAKEIFYCAVRIEFKN